MLIDKIKKLQEADFYDRSIVETEELFEEMAQALIAVDDVLKGGRIIQVTSTPLNKFAEGNNAALTEIRKAIESHEDTK